MRLILSADDFGRSSRVNRAILRAHREGLLTSASLMVTGEAVAEAVELARQNPALTVGLHLVMVDGRPACRPEDIPHLVNGQGLFPADPVRVGLHYFLSRTAQRELARELRAQFERFAATGLRLSHIDGHFHLHMHPTILRMLLPLAREYGAGGIRVVRDDFRLSLAHERRFLIAKAGRALCFGLLSHWCRRQLRGYALPHVDRVYGLMQTGRMGEAYVSRLLQCLRAETAEMYFHPTEGETISRGANAGDLETLLSPRLAAIVRERGIRLISYAQLRQAATSEEE